MMGLSRIKEIPPRTVWPNEATDFTPWLAEEENLNLLGEVISLDLEAISREEKMDGGRADLLCVEPSTGRNVLIENQLEKTDPDHLGRILSYASALNVNTIIWIATVFDEQYRATLDWLNRITDEEFNFFGIEIHLLQIGDSDYAPQFKIVAKPNDWQKRVKASSKVDDGDLSETKKNQKHYWEEFCSYMQEHKSSLFKTQSPSPQHWMNIAVGKSGYNLSLGVNSREHKLTVQFWINDRAPKTTFDTLKSKYEKDSVQEISKDIDWQRLDERKQCSIQLSTNYDFMDIQSRNEQFKWLKENAEKFIEFFRPKIKELSIN